MNVPSQNTWKIPLDKLLSPCSVLSLLGRVRNFAFAEARESERRLAFLSVDRENGCPALTALSLLARCSLVPRSFGPCELRHPQPQLSSFKNDLEQQQPGLPNLPLRPEKLRKVDSSITAAALELLQTLNWTALRCEAEAAAAAAASGGKAFPRKACFLLLRRD